jgi:ABC-type nitrate/sulfonate/bicarbonate transport system ATPase subunit
MVLKIKKLSKEYNGENVLDNFDMELKKGEIAEIKGPTGSGKTTLKRCIAGLEDYNGYIEVKGDIAYLFQEERILSWLNVEKNILTPLKLKGIEITEEKRKEMKALAERLEVSKHLKKDINQISGGELQRILIIRALITKPDLLLMDEPFNSLDPKTKEEIYRKVKEICKDMNTTVLIASHNENQNITTERTIKINKHKKSD